MKLTSSIEARAGHVPNKAICSIGQTILFDEKLMQGLPPEVVSKIKASGGELPDILAIAVAKSGCFQYVNGKCRLLDMAPCRK